MTALGWRRWVPIPLGLALGLASGSSLDALNVADGRGAGAVAIFVFLHALALCFVPPLTHRRHLAIDHDLRRQLWFLTLPLLAVGIAIVWALSGLFEGSGRLEEGTRVFMFAAPLLGVAWSVESVSRRIHTRLGHGWLRTPLCIAACWSVAMAAALLLAVGAPKIVLYPIYGADWLELTRPYTYDYPWIALIALTYAGIHATALSILAPISENVWRWKPSAPTPTPPWALYAVVPAALLQLAWVALVWDFV